MKHFPDVLLSTFLPKGEGIQPSLGSLHTLLLGTSQCRSYRLQSYPHSTFISSMQSYLLVSNRHPLIQIRLHQPLQLEQLSKGEQAMENPRLKTEK